MTEEEWLGLSDPRALLEYLRNKASARKLRLYAIACCSRFPHLVVDNRTRLALIVAAEYCEGRISEKQLGAAEQALWTFVNDELPIDPAAVRYLALAARQAAKPEGEAWASANVAGYFVQCATEHRRDERVVQCDLIRKIFGNPFRPVSFDPNWRTWDVMALAAGIYDEKAFDRTPILADALQDAGCDSDAILNHLRGPDATHVRGCWVLDLVLGKE